MNCKPGDLAITVNAPMDNGLIVEVSELFIQHPTAGPSWVVTSQGSPFHFKPTELRQTVLWPDALLRPLGRPADHVEHILPEVAHV